MKLVAHFIAFMNNFFRICAEYSRPAWEFRIRFSIDKRKWVIELHENGDQQWRPLSRQDEGTDDELHVLKFDTYQAAYEHALTQGLHLAYEQAHFTRDRRALHPAATAIEHSVLHSTLGGMGASFSNNAVRERVVQIAPSAKRACEHQHSR